MSRRRSALIISKWLSPYKVLCILCCMYVLCNHVWYTVKIIWLGSMHMAYFEQENTTEFICNFYMYSKSIYFLNVTYSKLLSSIFWNTHMHIVKNNNFFESPVNQSFIRFFYQKKYLRFLFFIFFYTWGFICDQNRKM